MIERWGGVVGADVTVHLTHMLLIIISIAIVMHYGSLATTNRRRIYTTYRYIYIYICIYIAGCFECRECFTLSLTGPPYFNCVLLPARPC